MTDQLEASFDAVVQGERIAGLESEVAALKGALLMQQRPALDGVKGGAVDPHRAAFVERYVRQGLEAGVELKSFSGASGAAGGYAVPREIDQIIGATLKAISPIRSIANVVRTGTAGYRKLVTAGGIVSGWASETGARAETATPSFNEIVPPSGELYANPAASQAMLDDAQFDVESWLAGHRRAAAALSHGADGHAGRVAGPGGLSGAGGAAVADTARQRCGGGPGGRRVPAFAGTTVKRGLRRPASNSLHILRRSCPDIR